MREQDVENIRTCWRNVACRLCRIGGKSRRGAERDKNVFEEVGGPRHEGITKSAEIRPVAHFFGEYVGRIAFPVDVRDGKRTVRDPLAGGIFPMLDVAITLRGQIVTPFHASVIVVVDRSGEVSVIDRVADRLEVKNHVAEIDGKARAHVSSADFSLA